MAAPVTLTGAPLPPVTVAAIARDGAPVAVDAAARARMRAAAEVVDRAVRDGAAVYGVTTGLGSRVVDRVPPQEHEAMALRILRARASAVGEPLAGELVRAAIAVRANGLCAGGAGAGADVAEGLVALLNAGVHPIVPASGSIGASDLCLMAHVGLTLIGEGEAELDGARIDSAAALGRAGLRPVALQPRDGLAICSSSAVSAGTAALALGDARELLDAAQAALALSMEGFRANLSPLDPRVVAARPAPGQAWAAAGLRRLLAGGALPEPGAARRLQDPLSFRCAASIHGSLHSALALLEAALVPELGGAADNPLVVTEDGVILPTGNFHVPALALALDAVALGLAQVASASVERQVRLKTERLSGLPGALTRRGPGATGVAAMTKTAQSLLIEIRHLAAPLSIESLVGGDGVEDDSTGATQAALRVRTQLERLSLLVALELAVAAQAVELAAPARLGAGTAAAQRCVRECVAALDEDRALGLEVQRLADELVRGGELVRRVSAAVAA